MRSDARKRIAEFDGCEHGAGWDDDCATCDAETAEAHSAGAWTPKEIGLYWAGKRATDTPALGAALILLDRTEQALRIIKADLDAQAVQLDEIRRVATEWAEDDWPQVDDYLRGHAAGMRAAGGAILGRLG